MATAAEPMNCCDELSDIEYNMNYSRRGYALILNNKNCDPCTGLKTRNGTDVDAEKLYAMCQKMGFQATVKKDLTCAAMLKEVRKVANCDHSDMDCVLLVILSHGTNGGYVSGTDGDIAIDILTSPFMEKNCPTLVGKPKCFIIQACRGSNFDLGVTLVADANDPESKPETVPRTDVDCLICFSTVPGFYSWRHSECGSWFVQSLCKVMEKIGATEEMMRILTRTNHMVAYEFESCTSRTDMNYMKQMPMIFSRLVKDLYFRPKCGRLDSNKGAKSRCVSS